LKTDSQTNFLFLAAILPKNYPDFYNRFEKVLRDCNIKFAFLPKSKDVWAAAHMPIQIELNKFIRFVYNSSYQKTKKYF